MTPTLFDELGGEPVLTAIVDRFVERVFADKMIGFFFARVSKARLKQLEYEFAARHLGANIPYTGRPIPEAHQKHRIMGGQFRRRLTILKETLADFGVAERIVDHWVQHTLSLEAQVTPDTDGACVDMVERKDS